MLLLLLLLCKMKYGGDDYDYDYKVEIYFSCAIFRVFVVLLSELIKSDVHLMQLFIVVSDE